MPECLITDDTAGYLDSATVICIFEKVQWHNTKCGILKSLFFWLDGHETR